MAGYEIVRADPARDRERILGVWTRNLPAHDPQEHVVRYDWICRGPTGAPRFWLARQNGEVVGTAGMALRRVCVDGRTMAAGIAGDFAVDARHRMLQPAMALQKAVLGALDDGVDVVYGLPNPNAHKIFERQGYRTLGGLTRYVKVLRTGKFLRSAKGWRAAARPLAPLSDLYLRLRSPETWRGLSMGRRLVPVMAFDERFDELWGRAAGRSTVAGVRTADFLRWRYADCPLQHYQTLGLTDGGGRLLGYITWYPGDDGQVRVADWFADGSDDAEADLLAGLIRAARRGGAASISCEYFGAEPLAAVLEAFGFVERECKAQLAVAPRAGLADDFVDRCRGWHFLRGDENVNTL